MTAEPRDVDGIRTLRQAIDSASPLPWVKHDDAMMHIARVWPNNVAVIATMRDIEAGPMGTRSSANRDLIVAAVNALPLLLDRLAAADRENAELRGELDGARTEADEARADLRREQDALATLYGGFAAAAEARDHAEAQVLIQNGYTNRAATAAGVEQQRAEAAEARLEAVRAIPHTASCCANGCHGHGERDAADCGNRCTCHLRIITAALSAAPQPEPEQCAGRLGERPSWMSEGQYDACRCKRTIGHDGECACEHTDVALRDAFPESRNHDAAPPKSQPPWAARQRRTDRKV